jgi:Ca2+-binding RTX toxin-like protein
MLGGAGNDAYNVDNAGDAVTVAVGAGTDTVYATVSYALGALSEVEVLRSNAATGLTLTGNEFNNTIIGGAANDTLFGGAGNDILNGNAGADSMAGGTGNDTYTVDNAADVVTEAVGQGTDTINASVSYTLAALQEVENLTASVATGLSLTGNEFNNTITGGAGADALDGGLGNDTLRGGGGTDTLLGGAGDDSLDGSTGADTMAGGIGNDTYFVDNAGDAVNEAAGEGTDTVWASASYSLAAGSGIESLKVNTAVGLTLTGNELSHNLVGNIGNDTLLGGAGNDSLNGGVGADTMAGGVGNDTYFVDNAGDVVNENLGEGSDTIFASVNYALTAGSEIEFLRANAGATGLSLTGNALANAIVGGVGSDTLDGGAGNDVLGGGAGNDVFKFSAAGFGQDTINDFAAGLVAGSQDLLDITGLGITAATFAASVKIAAGAGGTTMVTFTAPGSTDSIRLLGVASASIDQTDFRLA